MTLGVLSRLGARVRAGATGVIMSKVDPQATAQVLDKLMADPDYFVEVAKRVTNKTVPLIQMGQCYYVNG